MNKKGQLEDIVDATVAFLLLIIVLLLAGLVISSIKYAEDVRYEWALKKQSMDAQLTYFLRTTASTGEPMTVALQDQDPSSQSLMEHDIKRYFNDYFGDNPWRLVVVYPDGTELEVDSAKGTSTTMAETYIPSNKGTIKIYLQTGDIIDDVKYGLITTLFRTVSRI